MSEGKQSVIREGARLLRRRQRVLWWLYSINLFLGLIGTLPMANNVGAVLNHSLAAEHLVKGFDLSFLAELAAQPTHPFSVAAPASILLAMAFFVLWLLFEGGILETYQRDSRLTTSAFFEAGGRMFWRFVRLFICMLIVLVPVFIATRGVKRWSDKLATDSPRAMMGFWVEVGGLLVVAVLLMAVRLWFDMTQVRTVAENERAMRRALAHALRLTLANFTTLFWIYLRIGLIAWAFSVAAFWAWIRLVQPEWIGVSFLLGQAVLLVWLGTRLGRVPVKWCGTNSIGRHRHLPGNGLPPSTHRLTSRLRACCPDSHWKTDCVTTVIADHCCRDRVLYSERFAVLLPNHSKIDALVA